MLIEMSGETQVNRRDFLIMSGAAGASLLLAGCGTDDPVGKRMHLVWDDRPDLTPAGINDFGVRVEGDPTAPEWPPEKWQKSAIIGVGVGAMAAYKRYGLASLEGDSAIQLGVLSEGLQFDVTADRQLYVARVRIGRTAFRGVMAGIKDEPDQNGNFSPVPLRTEVVAVTTVTDPQWQNVALY